MSFKKVPSSSSSPSIVMTNRGYQECVPSSAENKEVNEDFISSLPAEVLSEIISHLDTKSAMRMSILSKNFRDLWARSPTICIFFKSHELSEKYLFHVKAERCSFEKNILALFSRRRTTDVQVFNCRLSLRSSVSPDFLKKFVDYAIGCGVRHLRIRGYTRFNFPAAKLSSLTSSMLKTLRLNNVNGQSFRLPKHVSFPNLEALRLKNFQLSGKRARGEMIFAGCPKLRDLILVKCWIRDGCNTLNVSCPNLKMFEIRDWSSPWERFHEQVIAVDAPCLVFFKFQGVMAKVDFKVDMPRLDSAFVDLRDLRSERMLATAKCFSSILSQMNHLKFITISTKTMEVISTMPVTGDVLNELEILKWKIDGRIKDIKDMMMGTYKEFDEAAAADSGGLHILLESSETEESFRYTTWNCDGRINLVKEVSRLMELKTKVEAADADV